MERTRDRRISANVGRSQAIGGSSASKWPSPCARVELHRVNEWYSPASREYKAFLRTYWDSQTQTFENNGQGWIFWTWKAPK